MNTSWRTKEASARQAYLTPLRRHAGSWIKSRRESIGYSQNDLAIALGKSVTFVSDVECGRIKIPTLAYVSWAEALKMDLKDFVQTLLEHYEPHLYAALFSDGEVRVAGKTLKEWSGSRSSARR